MKMKNMKNEPKAMTIPAARALVDRMELAEELNSFSLRQFQDVVREARSRKVHAHLASLMDLCHLKHSQLAEHCQTQTGRDRASWRSCQSFFLALKQCLPSNALMAAAKDLDAIPMLLGMDGEASHAALTLKFV